MLAAISIKILLEITLFGFTTSGSNDFGNNGQCF